jgi:hypothetical protein
MNFFTIIPDAQAIIHSGGVYRQAQLYLRGDRIYAKYGSGFVRLAQGGSTSAPKIRWSDMYCGEGAYSEASGYVTYVKPVGQTIEGSAAPKRVAAE